MAYSDMKELIDKLFKNFTDKTGIKFSEDILKLFKSVDDAVGSKSMLPEDMKGKMGKMFFNVVYTRLMDVVANETLKQYREQKFNIENNNFQELNNLMRYVYSVCYSKDFSLALDGNSKLTIKLPIELSTRDFNAYTRDLIKEQGSSAFKDKVDYLKHNNMYNEGMITTYTNSALNSLAPFWSNDQGDIDGFTKFENGPDGKFDFIEEREAVCELAVMLQVQREHYKNRNFFSKLFFGRKERNIIRRAEDMMSRYVQEGKTLEETIKEYTLPGSSVNSRLTNALQGNTKANTLYHELDATFALADLNRELDDEYKNNPDSPEYKKEKAKLQNMNEPVRNQLSTTRELDRKLESYNRKHPDKEQDYKDLDVHEKKALYEKLYGEKFVLADNQPKQENPQNTLDEKIPENSKRQVIDVETKENVEEIKNNENVKEEDILSKEQLEQLNSRLSEYNLKNPDNMINYGGKSTEEKLAIFEKIFSEAFKYDEQYVSLDEKAKLLDLDMHEEYSIEYDPDETYEAENQITTEQNQPENQQEEIGIGNKN